jgi:SulP family sulfate permease
MIFWSLAKYRSEWAESMRSIPREILAGMVGTFALIPEVIAFSFVAGVDPEVGLFASFIISIVISIAGGRPAMIFGASGSVALVAAPLVRAHGVDYLFAAGPMRSSSVTRPSRRQGLRRPGWLSTGHCWRRCR